MADQSDVETALAGAVGGALYPNGLAVGCVVAGAVVRIYRGWPLSAGLDADLAAGRGNVSIFCDGASENTTRWPDADLYVPTAAPVLQASVAGTTVTLSGSAALGQIAAVIADNVSAAYRTQPGDTPAAVAAALAKLLGVAAAGSAISVPGARTLIARVEADQPILQMTRRQRQTFKVTCWCPDPITRDRLGSAIDSALSGIDFIGLADGTSGRLRAVGSQTSDRWEDAALYRRELTYSVDYATTIASALPRMAVGVAQIAPDGTVVSQRLS